tara:strand:- start:7350 stop:9203 length:1854 start_codon:yes stop_codon:yes gene_type:complete
MGSGTNKKLIEAEVAKLLRESGDSSYLSESAMNKLRNKFSDQSVLDEIQETYVEITREQKANAKKFARKVLQKYGLQYPLHILLKKAMKYKAKYGISDLEFSIFQKTYTQYIIGSSNTDDKVKKFYSPQTTMTKVLGSSDRYGDSIHVKTDELKYLDDIMKLDSETKSLHAHVALQSMTYPDKGFSISATTGKFDRNNWQNPSCYISPILAAMFIPKFRIFEDHMLVGSIARIVKTRKQRKPITTAQDYELFYDLISDPTDMACSVESPVHDLKLRAQLQYAVWQNVLYLRYGKYFDCTANAFTISIENCKLNNYDEQPDFFEVGDEIGIVRKIFSAFSLRPTIVQTNMLSNLEYQHPIRPDVNGVEIKVESTPMLIHRVTTTNTTPMGVSAATEEQKSLKYVLNSTQYFFDRDIKTVVPRTVHVIYSKSVLVIALPRRAMRVDFTNVVRPAHYYQSLPRVFSGIDKINNAPIDVPLYMELSDNNGGSEETMFSLQSAIRLNTEELGNSTGMIIGTSAILCDTTSELANLGVNSNSYKLYDPRQVLIPAAQSTNRGDGVFRDPIAPLLPASDGGSSEDPATALDLLEHHCTVFFYKSSNDNKIDMPTPGLGQYYSSG